MLRAMMRYKMTYMVFCRAYSKTFTGTLALICKAILYPGITLFTVAPGKEQSANMLVEKIKQLTTMIPALNNEIMWDTRGNKNAITRQTKDSVVYTFRNGSVIKNIAMNETTRGQRFQSGNMEECATLDQDILQQVVIPTLNISRSVNGKVDPDEVVNQSQIYLTSAGFKGTFAYDKLIETLCKCVADPANYFILGGDWRIPAKFGAFDKNYIQDLKNDGTMNEGTFDREFNSRWGGDVEAAFFNSKLFDKYRVLNLPEYQYNNKTNDKGFYVLGVDVGRYDCTTEIVVIKVTPVAKGYPMKQIVNIFSIVEDNFTAQAIKIKQLFNQYKCKAAVVDGNGIGAGLVDLLVQDQTDPDTNEPLWNLGVIYKDDEERQRYKNYETPDTIYNALYIMKANAPLNTEMYSYCRAQMQHGRLRFLIDDNTAKLKLMDTAKGKAMEAMERNQYLMPFIQTNILREQMVNLVQDNEGVNIMLKGYNRSIKHDKFSALIYGLYYCKLQEDKGKKRGTRDLSKMMLYSKASR